MPVIPYPNAVRALHQIGRHQVERASRWTVTLSPRYPHGFRPTILRNLTEDEARDLVSKLDRNIFRFLVSKIPGQRRPSDG